MKKFLALILALLMALSLVACGNKTDNGGDTEENKLVVYTAASDEQLDVIIPLYEEMYGVEVEVVSAGTGEMLARADSEKANLDSWSL